MPLDAILRSQHAWANVQWPAHTDRRAPSLDANLILPMSPDVRDQYKNGSGDELGTPQRPGKMYSLRSSSALAYNLFAPWIGHDLRPLAAALGSQRNDDTLQFERKFPHGLTLAKRGLTATPPNLDVTLDNSQPRPLAVECKFTEPYGAKKPHPPLDQKYFDGGRARWAELGLVRCQALAESLGQGVEFKRLGVGQLLKHILGLAWTTKQPPRLVCLWFDSNCVEAHEHADELNRFSEYLDDAIEFRAVSYQQAFASLQNAPEPMPGYLEYLAARYFAA